MRELKVFSSTRLNDTLNQLNKEKFKQTVMIAVFVSLGAFIQIDILVDGFIVGFSVVVFAIFIYSYVQLSPMYIAVMSGIFSPGLRFLDVWFHSGDFTYSLISVFPDAAFFISYGLILTIIRKLLHTQIRVRNNFLWCIGISDFLANNCEFLIRSILTGELLLDQRAVVILAVIALSRTALIAVIIIAMEANGDLIARKEHEDEYRKLTVMASEMCNELYLMQKNIGEIENLMKNAYTLSKELEEVEVPKTLRVRSLEIAKDAHEIKGDYVRAINSMRDEFVDKYEQATISMSDICEIITTDINQYINKNCPYVTFYSKVKTDFLVREHFEMVSIIRNLIYNSIEAIMDENDRKAHYIYLVVTSKGEDFVVSVQDNGPGIPAEIIGSIFLSKFSTKFSAETGNMYRGIGLQIVKDYIEKYFGGTISVSSEPGKLTEFVIRIPKEGIGVYYDEVLHN